MTNDMTKGSPIKLILSFMVPLLIGNIFQQFYNMAGYDYCRKNYKC